MVELVVSEQGVEMTEYAIIGLLLGGALALTYYVTQCYRDWHLERILAERRHREWVARQERHVFERERTSSK